MNYGKIIKLSMKLQTLQKMVTLCYQLIGEGHLDSSTEAVFRLVIEDTEAEILKKEKTLRIYVGK